MAVGLGHPLLRDEECVRNDLSLTVERPLLLISGSNMSGKSTWLRSIGSALVLTLCGAVVRAKQFRTYPFQLATAMRVSDSLQEGRSLFFSVVRRLKTVVDLTGGQRTVLFLLDEILNGTNSNDRRQGAEAVIRTLVSRGALGLVTTHDLALTEIASSLPGKAENKHFEDSVVNGRMTFDYRLRDGVVERSNAIALMRLVGLDV
jgi:DNA mismatch repair ATPase MutS